MATFGSCRPESAPHNHRSECPLANRKAFVPLRQSVILLIARGERGNGQVLMLTFKGLLETAGIDPHGVRLARHQTDDGPLTPWQLWRSDSGRFELYQRIQRKKKFDKASHVASFVVTPDGRTLFVGLYSVDSIGTAPKDAKCPLRGIPVAGFRLYELTRCDVLSDYTNRLVVDWGPGQRAWVQRAHLKPKPIVELAREQIDPPFPGFLSFQKSLSSIEALPGGWREALASVRGVYLLTDPNTGENYVGSATGEDGFLGRWFEYAATGHGGNVRMKARETADYTVAILEVASSIATVDEINKRESLWKKKLGTREHGLNVN